MKLNSLSKFLLLAHHPEKGRFIIADIHVNYGIIGAALLEMSLDGQFSIKENKLIPMKKANADNVIISEISKEIRSSKKTRKINYWITKLARKSRKYKWAILGDLEKNGLLRIENRKFLGLISYKKSYLVESNTRDALINQLRKDALSGKDLSNETILMLALVEACKMHKIITSDKVELKRLKQELKEIMKKSPIADSVDKTIMQVQAAIIGGIVASTVAASGSASH